MNVPFDSSVQLHVLPHCDGLSSPVSLNSNQRAATVPFFRCLTVDAELEEINRCNFSTDLRTDYLTHLHKDHQDDFLVCFYCSQLKKIQQLKLFEFGLDLLRHIDLKHKHRNYQCNLCEYRAISPEHVSVHQASAHKSSFAECLVLSCGKAQDSSSCDDADDDVLRIEYFYEQFRVRHLASSSYQCLFCTATSPALSVIVNHLVRRHPDYPMLYYLPNRTKDEKEEKAKPGSLLNGSCFAMSKESLNSVVEFCSDEEMDEASSVLMEESYVCFFCSDYISTSSSEMKAHLCGHLFGNERHALNRNSPDDAFFLAWLYNFVNMQKNTYLQDDDDDDAPESYLHDLCHICIDLFRSRTVNLVSADLQDRLTPDMQKVHYILHSCVKTIKCSFCELEDQDDFWMPDLKSPIVMHLYTSHRDQVEAMAQLCDLDLFNFTRLRELTELEWNSTYKPILINAQVIVQYASNNAAVDDAQWKLDNRLALEKLEQRYGAAIAQFDEMIAAQPEAPAIEVEHFVDDPFPTEPQFLTFEPKVGLLLDL